MPGPDTLQVPHRSTSIDVLEHNPRSLQYMPLDAQPAHKRMGGGLAAMLSLTLLGLGLVIGYFAFRHLNDNDSCADDADTYVRTGHAQYLWPQPAEFTSGDATLRLSRDFSWGATPSGCSSGAAVTAAMERFVSDADLDLGGIADLETEYTATVSKGTVCFHGFATMYAEGNDAYTLSVDETDGVVIEASTQYGALNALTSLAQLLERNVDLENSLVTNLIPACPWVITDSARFVYRSLLVDTARQYLSMELLKRIVDGLALVKMNTLHWHMTDATSFPYKGESHPELAEGAYSAEQVYTAADVQELYAYAQDRGVMVVPEIDTPGHASSWGVAYPDLMACNGAEFQYWPNCPGPPCGFLDVTQPEISEIAVDVLNEMVAVTSQDTVHGIVHLGADEPSLTCWGEDTAQYVTDWITGLVGNLTGSPRVLLWSDCVESFDITSLSKTDTFLQFWDGDKNDVAALGYRMIMTDATNWYLDCGKGEWLGFTGSSWCAPFKSWQLVYFHDPMYGLDAQYEDLVYGGEVALWGEQAGESNYEPELWPRTSAMAERLWSPQSQRDPRSAQYRLWEQHQDMSARLINTTPLQPQYCRLNAGVCNNYEDTPGTYAASCDAPASLGPFWLNPGNGMAPMYASGSFCVEADGAYTLSVTTTEDSVSIFGQGQCDAALAGTQGQVATFALSNGAGVPGSDDVLLLNVTSDGVLGGSPSAADLATVTSSVTLANSTCSSAGFQAMTASVTVPAALVSGDVTDYFRVNLFHEMDQGLLTVASAASPTFTYPEVGMLPEFMAVVCSGEDNLDADYGVCLPSSAA